MEIKLITEDKKQFLDLLLLADESEIMIDKYLERGDLFVLYDNGLKGICVVTYEKDNTYELKNIAVYKEFQRQGYGKALIDYILGYYRPKCKTMFVGTGESLISFYENCGFYVSHKIKNFFVDNYPHPMYENGVQLVDMIYLSRSFE